MQLNLRSLVVGLFLLAGIVAAAPAARAQGITGSAVTGTVTAEGGGPVEGAEVHLRNPGTGEVFSAVTNAAGQYFVDNVPPGGPYTLTVSAAGFPPTTQEDIQLTLGQRLKLDLTMQQQVVEQIVVQQRMDALHDKGRTGPTTTVRGSAINRLPLQGRNFTDLIATSPQVSGAGGASSIGGQNNRFNNIQIDGGANNDLFGLATSGTPGGQSNAKPLSIEAIKEFVVQMAPFDVRQGSFTGGLVNAVTKSGSNNFEGSLFTYYQNKSFAGNRDDPTFLDFHTLQFGASLGGPIIRDKLHFFVALDLQDKSQSFGNPFQLNGDPTHDMSVAGFTTAQVQQFTQILATKYNINGVGDALAPALGNPDHNVFGKVTWGIDDRNRAELSYNFVQASLDQLTRAPTSVGTINPAANQIGNLRDGYELSNSGYSQVNSTNTLRLKLTSRWGEDISNEFLGGFSFIRDHRDMPQTIPLILVKVGTFGASDSWLAAGGERFSHQNLLDQNIFQLQDNVTFGLGDHRLTVGTSNEFFHFRNVFFQAAYGVWAFNSLDDLAAGTAVQYERRFGVSDLQEPGTAEFSVAQLGFYAQDEWTPIKNLTITPGIRVDVPFLSGANTNPALVNNTAFPIDTSKVPTGNPLWSPRLGFNWDVEGTADTIVRGGAGVFSGRPPYVWVSNAYTVNGLSQVQLRCFGSTGVPTFTTADPNMQPSDCKGGTGTPTAPKNQGEIDYFNPDTKFPQNFQSDLGVDKRLPWDLIGSVDLLYTHDVNGWYTTDENLEVTGTSGEGRTTYGRFVSNPNAFNVSTVKIDPANLGNAVEVYNKSEGQVWTATLQLQKRFGRRYEVQVGYTYSNSQDLLSFTSSQAFSNYQFAPLDGTIKERNLRPSAFDRTHKITLTGTAAFPYGFELGLTYVGLSGTPYTFITSGDVNGDGVNGNDLVFVPAKPSDISLKDPTQWDALNKFIDSQDCLAGARGRLVQRGECRNPFSNIVNVRLAWGMHTIASQRFLIQLDIFDFLNMFNSSWGTFDQAGPFETASTFLKAVGYDGANNRPIYSFLPPVDSMGNIKPITSTVYSPTSSRWRIQLGARYEF